MEIKITERIAQPLDKVWAVYRDRLPELSPYLPNVTSITVKSREEPSEGVVRLVNEWCVAGAVPGPARRFFKEDMLRYIDHAAWNWEKKTCHWRFEFPALGEALTCQGMNQYRILGDDTCELKIDGELSLDLGKIRRIPRMFRRLGPMVEGFVIERVKPNLIEVCRAVEKLLAES